MVRKPFAGIEKTSYMNPSTANHASRPAWRKFDLPQWIEYIQQQHFRSIDMTLSRAARVWSRLDNGTHRHTVSVAGTNGKGSTVAYLEKALVCSGLRTGSYTSPHLVRFNERIRIDGIAVADADLCRAFCRIEEASDDTPLTFFEYATLCALWIFQCNRLQVQLLEVGMGGRLDAVNIVDADIAVITAIGLDHMAWLGPDRETIALEKAGIIRRDRPVVCSDPQIPDSLGIAAAGKSAPMVVINRDYFLKEVPGGWQWSGKSALFPHGWKTIGPVHAPLSGQHQQWNLSGALAALSILAGYVRLDRKQVARGIAGAAIQARCQIVSRWPLVVLDVAHNMDSVCMLAEFLARNSVKGTSIAVFGTLRDKAPESFVAMMDRHIDRWMLAGLDEGERGQTARELAQKMVPVVEAHLLECFDSPQAAYRQAIEQAGHQGRIIVFGSFITVGAILPLTTNAQNLDDSESLPIP